MISVETTLRNARKLIARGWTRGAYSHGGTQFCAVGALHRVLEGQNGPYMLAIDTLESVIGHPDVIGWNDAPERTQEHVIVAFSLAIARAKRDSL